MAEIVPHFPLVFHHKSRPRLAEYLASEGGTLVDQHGAQAVAGRRRGSGQTSGASPYYEQVETRSSAR